MAGWAISRVVGDGTFPRPPWDDTNGPWRAVAEEYGPCTVLIPPGSSWAFVRYGDAFDAASADADPDVRVLPNLSMDHVLTNPEAGAINRHLDDFSISGVTISAGMTVRVVLRAITDALDVTWDPEAQVVG